MSTQGVKRSAPESNEILEDVKAIVVDIEGTTAPASFIKEVLITYVKENVKSYLETNFDADECKADVQALRDQASKDQESGAEGVVLIQEGDDKDAIIKSLVDSIMWQLDNNRKSTSLSQFEGHIWRDGYKSGKIQGKLFEDVAPAVREWVSEKRKVYAYSSGSVESQKLYFSNSSCGNIGDLFSGHFDTTTGEKEDKESYKKIASELSLDPAEILFLTDKTSEAEPASEAGLKTSLVVRDDTASLTDEDKQKFNVIDSFAELTSATNGSAKRVEADGDAGTTTDDVTKISDESSKDSDEVSKSDDAVDGDTAPAEEQSAANTEQAAE